MPLRVIFVGTPEFAVPSLRAIAGASHSLLLVVTQPDRPKGRGRKLAAPPVKEAAEELGVPVLQPPSINDPDCVRQMQELDPDVIAVVAFSQKLSKEVLNLARLGAFNLHGSLLPKFRGAAPFTYAIWNGTRVTGLTIFRMVEKMDAGEIALQRETPIEPEDTAGDLHDRLKGPGGDLFIDFLDRLEKGEIEFRKQDESLVSFAHTLVKEQGRIQWDKPADDICRHIRAMTPWPGAFTHRTLPQGQELRVIILKAIPVYEPTEIPPGTENALILVAPMESPPGTVIDIDSEAFTLAAASGAVRVLRVQPSGKRPMDAAAFLRGTPLKVGEAFSSPNADR